MLTPSFFLIFRKIIYLEQLVWSSLLLFFIIINAETWFLNQKYNGLEALLIQVPFSVFGIIGAVWFRKQTKAYPLVIIWHVIFLVIVIGNRSWLWS